MTNKIISVYWFVILFIVAGAIAYMAVLFYGEPYDVREIETNIMINQIADCLSKGGKLRGWVIDEDDGKKILGLTNENILEKCHLNFNVEDFKGWKNNQYYVEVGFYEFDINAKDGIGKPFGKSVFTEVVNWKDNCEDKKKTKSGFCVERSFYVLDENNTPYSYIIKILSAVRKTEKNVR